MNTKTWTPRAAEIERRWFVIDAEGQTLGRLATKVASTLMGKGKPTFADHLDSGDFVIVINSAKLVVTGDRLLSKKYHSTPVSQAVTAWRSSATCSSASRTRRFDEPLRACSQRRSSAMHRFVS